ncbi:FitA-like ribbon-helix-helix domain-containing protein [Nocardiopsis coralliicola]
MAETTVVQVREVPADAVEVLKERAARRGQSLSAYLRELILEEAAHPDLEQVMERLAAEAPIHYTASDLEEFRSEGRR